MQNNTLSRPGFSLSGTALKRIACLSMLIDHIGAALLETSRVYVSPVFSGAPQPICLADEHGPVDVYLLLSLIHI